jgi:hypothetical protein
VSITPGQRHLANLLTAPLPSGPIGEASLRSDRDDKSDFQTGRRKLIFNYNIFRLSEEGFGASGS